MRRRPPMRKPARLDDNIARRTEAKLDRLLIVWERILAKCSVRP